MEKEKEAMIAHIIWKDGHEWKWYRIEEEEKERIKVSKYYDSFEDMVGDDTEPRKGWFLKVEIKSMWRN